MWHNPRVLVEVARQLDRWIAEENSALREAGLPAHAACKLQVIGQTALLESGLSVHLANTVDVDIRSELEFPLRKQLEKLLAARGRSLDPLAHEAWMPRETTYRKAYGGKFVQLLIADPEAVLVSKALKAPDKNRVLLTDYLAHGPSARFLDLATKYHVDLEQFL